MTPSVWRNPLGSCFDAGRSIQPPGINRADNPLVHDYSSLGDYAYETRCVEANGDDINEMVESAIAVGYETIRRHCAGLKAWEIEHGYDPLGRGMSRVKCVTLDQDWHVSFHRGRYRGRRCYFVRHSSIEYIWCEKAQPGVRAA